MQKDLCIQEINAANGNATIIKPQSGLIHDKKLQLQMIKHRKKSNVKI